jgi:hypothetical protein
MDFKITGTGEFQKKLRDLAKRAEQLDGSHEIPLRELLSPSFIAGCSRFASVEELFQASGFTFQSAEHFKAIPESDLNAFIKNNTSFDGWHNMIQVASAEWTKKQLGLG